MTLRSDLLIRASDQCELCGSDVNLSPYSLTPTRILELDCSVLLCDQCLDSVDEPTRVNEGHWKPLAEAIWSGHVAVQVLCYRILSRLGGPWAQSLLDQIYLEEEDLHWAQQVLSPTGADDAPVTKDSNGNRLAAGDSVTLIKDLEVKGGGFTAKRGTLVKNISLSDDAKYVEGKVNGIQIVLVAAYLKKT
jgi:protein PhnA